MLLIYEYREPRNRSKTKGSKGPNLDDDEARSEDGRDDEECHRRVELVQHVDELGVDQPVLRQAIWNNQPTLCFIYN